MTCFEKQILFVFGMGRSGTSALTRVLSLCGVSLPDVLLGANEGNPKGHWEPLDALLMNEDFLLRHGSTWFDPTLRLQGEFVFHDEEREAYIELIRAFLKTCASGRLTVIKEPRIMALSDFWFEASQRAGFATKIVIPVRRPDEVAASLAARDQTSLELSSVLWLKYNLLAERRSRTLPRVFVEYPNLLSDWRREIARISEALSIELTAPNEAEIDAFLDHNLHHQKHSGTPTEVFGLPLVLQVYAAFSAAARGAPLDLQAMDEIFATYSKCERTFRISLDDFRSRTAPASRPPSADGVPRSALPKEFRGYELQMLKQAVVERDCEIGRLRGEIEELQGVLAAVQKSATWRLLEILRRVRRLVPPTGTRRAMWYQSMISAFRGSTGPTEQFIPDTRISKKLWAGAISIGVLTVGFLAWFIPVLISMVNGTPELQAIPD